MVNRFINKVDDYTRTLDEAHFFRDERFSHDLKGFPILENDANRKTLRGAPNFALCKDNIMQRFMDESEFYLAHITPSKDLIVDEGRIRCSGGCLVGGVYCVPAFRKENGRFTLHNLGNYIYRKEASYFSDSGGTPHILLFKIKRPDSLRYAGINYLKLGKFHLHVFEELKFLLNAEERLEMEQMVFRILDESRELIHLVQQYKSHELYDHFELFYQVLQRTIDKVQIFGYFLFEITSEYIVYYQSNEQSKRYAALGEIYVESFKDLVFRVVPNLTKKFDLGQFSPSMRDMRTLLESLGLNFVDYQQFIIDSLRFYIEQYLFEGKINPAFFNEKIGVDALSIICPHFVGHILHRIIRKMNRYPNFHFSFDTYKAIKIWSYWNEHHIYFPVNQIMPKGEMAINPTTPNLEYEVYGTNAIDNTEDGVAFDLKDRLDIKITPQLVELSKLLMRRKNG